MQQKELESVKCTTEKWSESTYIPTAGFEDYELVQRKVEEAGIAICVQCTDECGTKDSTLLMGTCLGTTRDVAVRFTPEERELNDGVGNPDSKAFCNMSS